MTQENIVNGMREYLQQDGMADYITMIEGAGLIGRIAGLIVGLLVMIVMVGIPLVISIEVCYINFPTFQGGYNNIHNRLKGKANQVFGLVIRDAVRAVDLSHTTEYGKSANLIYLRIKIKAIFLCVFIVALVLGPGEVLIAYAWQLLQGIFAALG